MRPDKVNFRILYASNHDAGQSRLKHHRWRSPPTPRRMPSRCRYSNVRFRSSTQNSSTIPVRRRFVTRHCAGEAAARATGKQVEFEVRGERSLLNHTNAAIHCFTWCATQSITALKRAAKVTHRRSPNTTTQITITVTDDGRGIDPSLIDQIFEPGFSTATEVSTISGRGVGLDVVKTPSKNSAAPSTSAANPAKAHPSNSAPRKSTLIRSAPNPAIFGCISCHFVARSNASATRNGDTSSYTPPVNMIATGRSFTKPHGNTTAGCPSNSSPANSHFPAPD